MTASSASSGASMDDSPGTADRVEAAAFADLYAAAPAGFAGMFGLRTTEIGGATLLLAPRIPDPFFNRVIGLGGSPTPAEADVDRIIGTFREAGSAAWWIHVSPGPTAHELTRWLLARGFVAPVRRSWAKVVRGSAPAPVFETSLEIREAAAGELAEMAAAICTAYGMPPVFAAWFEAVGRRPAWRAFVARANAHIVGGGLLFLDGTAAWLGAGGVLPSHRGRNAHRMLMAQRIDAAIRAGCSRIYTETGEPIGDERNPSLANMMRCGFEKVCSRLNYAAPAG